MKKAVFIFMLGGLMACGHTQMAEKLYAEESSQVCIYKVEGTDFGSGFVRVENEISKIDGVERTIVNPREGTVKIYFNSDKIDINAVETAIETADNGQFTVTRREVKSQPNRIDDSGDLTSGLSVENSSNEERDLDFSRIDFPSIFHALLK